MNSAAATSDRAATSSRYLQGDQQEFEQKFNRYAFEFAHHLVDHPLMQLPRITQLVNELPRENFYFDAGDIRIDQRWDQSPRGQWPLDEMIERIENAQAFIIAKRVEFVPEYEKLLDDCLAEAESMIKVDLRKATRSKEGIIFVTSPNRITAYHIDRECNFLTQIRGRKHISIFDKYDDVVLPQVERERFWAVDNNAALYKPELQDRATVFELRPGSGVHIPVNAPHWVQNTDNVSITFAITFQFHDDALADVYRANYYLRKLGLNPQPPGRSRLRDGLKSTAFSCARTARNLLRKPQGHATKAYQ